MVIGYMVFPNGFCVSIKGYLSYIQAKFEDLVPTNLGSAAFGSIFGYMVISEIWSILAGPDVQRGVKFFLPV